MFHPNNGAIQASQISAVQVQRSALNQKMSAKNTEQQGIVEEEPEDGVPIVLVTGASGFIATHVIKQLLEQGNYHVRGTVRSKKREDKVQTILHSVVGSCYM